MGAGGHARSMLGVLQDIGCEVIGVIANGVVRPETLAGVGVLGGLAAAAVIHQKYPQAGWVMAIGDNYHRLRIMHEIQASCPAVRFPVVVHPSAVVAADVELAEGVAVMPGAVVMAGCHLGACSLVNTRASLDHESVLAEGAALAPGAVIGGRVRIGRRSFIGIGAVIAQGVAIGADALLGAGALLLQSLPARSVAYGAPAKVVRSRAEDEPYF